MSTTDPTPQINGIFAQEMASLRRRISALQAEDAAGERLDEVLIQDLEVAHEELRVAGEEIRTQQAELDQVKQLQERRTWQQERLTALLPVAVFTTNSSGLIRAANAASSALLRIRVDQLLGKPLMVFVDEPERAALRRALSAAVHDLLDFRKVVTLRPARTEPFDVELQATVSADPVTGAVEITWLVLAARGSDDTSLSDADSRRGLAQALVELTRLPLGGKDSKQVLTEAARVCARALGEGASVSITLGPTTDPKVIATSEKTAQVVDGAQMLADEGPCAEAWRTSTEIWSQDLQDDQRWRRLAAHLQATSVAGAIALPFGVSENPVGTFNIYQEDAAGVGVELAETAHLLSTALAAIVHEMEARSELESLTEQLRTALVSRATIDQAKGIVMVLEGCSAEEAFRRLVRVSSRTNTKLRDVAARVVEEAQEAHS